jgi:threonine synthase
VWTLAERRWACACGGLLDLIGPAVDPIGRPDLSPLDRYARSLPPLAPGADLGLAVTPLVSAGVGRWLKADQGQPTGSFKDRGAAAMLGAAAAVGVGSVVVDSSGSAGRAAAAHCRSLGLRCRVFVPKSTVPAKVEAITRFGAEAIIVPGPRAAAALAAQAELGGADGPWYASHAHQPAFHHGVKTLAFELFEQFLGDLATATVAVPAGNGTLVLGLALGFQELLAAGRIKHSPALVAVQAAGCAPLAREWGVIAGGPPAGEAETVAAGIAVADPPRRAQVLARVRASGGQVLAVGDGEILAAQAELKRMGQEVEPTGAVAWAGAARLPRDRTVIAVLTGRWGRDDSVSPPVTGRRATHDRPQPMASDRSERWQASVRI